MIYLILYQIGGLGAWFYDGAFDDSDAALKHLRDAAREHPGRTYAMHPVHPDVAALLRLEVSA